MFQATGSKWVDDGMPINSRWNSDESKYPVAHVLYVQLSSLVDQP